jgi:hypothetical protein
MIDAYNSKLENDQQARRVFADVREILCKRHDCDFPQPRLIACPERPDSFMSTVKPHSEIRFHEAFASLLEGLMMPPKWGETDERCAILFNDPQQSYATPPMTSMFAQVFAHEIGHCVLYKDLDLIKIEMAKVAQEPQAIDKLHEGFATYLERDFLASLTIAQRLHFGMTAERNQLQKCLTSVSFGAEWLLSSRFRFYNRADAVAQRTF